MEDLLRGVALGVATRIDGTVASMSSPKAKSKRSGSRELMVALQGRGVLAPPVKEGLARRAAGVDGGASETSGSRWVWAGWS